MKKNKQGVLPQFFTPELNRKIQELEWEFDGYLMKKYKLPQRRFAEIKKAFVREYLKSMPSMNEIMSAALNSVVKEALALEKRNNSIIRKLKTGKLTSGEVMKFRKEYTENQKRINLLK